MEAVSACPRCDAPAPEGARFCASCGAALTDVPREERRVVTVLFGDLSGFTEMSERRDAEAVKAVVDRAFERLAGIVAEFGGRVDKIIGDEIMAVFGAPQAHEDDPERAVRAALAMQRALADHPARAAGDGEGFGLQMHAGINTGEVVAGFVGGSDSYTVLGDVVNTARRIASAARPGQVLAGAATYETSKDAIEYRRLGEVTAKGKRLPVPVWEALSERGLPGERARRAAPLTGREEELAMLEAAAAIVRRDRRPMTVTILGEAGMGKTRLAAELSRRLTAQGTSVLEGRSLPYGTVSPAFAVEEMVATALCRDRGDLPEEARGLDAAAAIFEQMALHHGLLVLAFHELHWSEDAVLDYVRALPQRSHAPLLVLCLARPELLERRPDWSTGVGSVTISLGPLPRERAGELLDTLAPSLPYAVREGVLDRAGGNPFYLEELARLLVDTGAERGEQFSVPVSVHALVTARLDALPPPVKRLLQSAAVVGERFWPGALKRLAEPDGAWVDEALSSPAIDELVEPFEAVLPGEPGYRFRQTMVRDVAYASVPKQVRAEQHAKAGSWLEDVACACGKEGEYYDLIAHHFESAATLAREMGSARPDAEAKAREYLTRAGDHALGMDAAVSATRFLRRALSFAEDDAERLALGIRLGEAMVGSWQDDAEEQLAGVLDLARRLGDRATEGKALRLLGDRHRMQGESERASALTAEALAIARETGDAREEAEGIRSHGLLDLMQGRWSGAAEWFSQSLERYRALEDRRGVGWSLQNLGWAGLMLGRFDDALSSLEEAEALFKEMGDHQGAGWCMGIKAWVLLMRGDIGGAGALAVKMEELLRTQYSEYVLTAGFVLELQRVLRAYVDVLRGRIDEAESLARAAIEADEKRTAPWVRSLGGYPVFAAAMLRRRLGAAAAAAAEGATTASATGDPFYQGQFAFARAWLAFEEGRPDDAEQLLDDLTRGGDLGQIWSVSAAVRWLRARILRARGDAEGARALLEHDVGKPNIGLVSPASARALLAIVLAETGDAQAAVATARAAVEESGEDVIARAASMRALARVSLAAGDAGEAERTARDELALLDQTDWHEERVRALAVLARALDALRRYDEAAEVTDRARALVAALPGDADTGAFETLLRG